MNTTKISSTENASMDDERMLAPVTERWESEFKLERLTNGMGHSHLVVITEPAIEDIHIGSVVIVPYAEGFKDPVKVVLQVDEKGNPIRNRKFGIPTKFIYEE
jgi:hypothetical protein